VRVRASTVCRYQDRLLTVRAIDPASKQNYLFLPGGGVEPNELHAAAAVRETMEETGYRIKVVGEPLVLAYRFIWSGKPFDCLTFFFRGEFVDPTETPAPTLDDDSNMHGMEWAPVDQIDTVFGYHDAILQAVRKLA
jgi:8-oxo-dGTP pyrophosphatase MutT (NUDIX family)